MPNSQITPEDVPGYLVTIAVHDGLPEHVARRVLAKVIPEIGRTALHTAGSTGLDLQAHPHAGHAAIRREIAGRLRRSCTATHCRHMAATYCIMCEDVARVLGLPIDVPNDALHGEAADRGRPGDVAASPRSAADLDTK